ncbi:trypsin-like serine protease [Xanthobacter sp. V3C-3]|uniref:S1 family peptidase n=1 Tax=Xanthobacter lutulentifluminis TaxID=3119935 RepID=UPI003727BD0F
MNGQRCPGFRPSGFRRARLARALRLGACALMLAAGLVGAGPARAIVGGGPAGSEMAAQTVLIVSTRGASCTGAVLARDLVLTAAHCVAPAADYAVAVLGDGAPKLVPAARVVVHPRFDGQQFQTRRPTPDLALVKLAEPLPARFRIARLADAEGLPSHGTPFVIAGYGMAADGAQRSAGTLRSVALQCIGTTGGIMVRLSTPEGGAGACTGDSGGPAFRDGALAGVTGWATGPGGSRGCGGVTGVTLVSIHRDWIEATARSLGSPLGR